MIFFQKSTDDYFSEEKENFIVKSKSGHTLIHYLIIFFIRSCRQLNKQNYDYIYGEIKKIVNASITRESLCFYSPVKGNSRIVPLLMRLKMIHFILWICHYKGNQRYGKLGGNKS